jgi:hypothetical protein
LDAAGFTGKVRVFSGPRDGGDIRGCFLER